jgi:transposase
VLTAAKALAQRAVVLAQQKQDLTDQLEVLVQQINPALRAAHGVGTDTTAQLLVTAGANPHRFRSEASFAALCGAAPVPASSGKITRHRLSRGGDRAANNALYRIALVRMSNHRQTRGYVERQLAKGRTKKEILRLLKRAIAREIFRLLTRPVPVDDYGDLRPARQAKNLTLATVATHFGVPTITISRIERGRQRNDTLVNDYRQWLTAA